jgi:hypothetical protein
VLNVFKEGRINDWPIEQSWAWTESRRRLLRVGQKRQLPIFAGILSPRRWAVSFIAGRIEVAEKRQSNVAGRQWTAVLGGPNSLAQREFLPHHFYSDETRLATMQNDQFGNDRRLEAAEYWHVRSQEARSRAEQMINPESRHLMSGLTDDYERAAHIVEGMASIRGALTSVMESVNGLLSQQ